MSGILNPTPTVLFMSHNFSLTLMRTFYQPAFTINTTDGKQVKCVQETYTAHVSVSVQLIRTAHDAPGFTVLVMSTDGQ